MTKQHNEKFFNRMSIAVLEAGEFAKKHHGKVENIGKAMNPLDRDTKATKAVRDSLTMVDLELQEMFIKAAAECLDVTTVLLDAEENTPSTSLFPNKNSETILVLDPLDGTSRYIAGESLYSINVGLVHKGKIVCTLLYFPAVEKMYVIDPDGKARVGSKTIEVKTSNSKKIYVNNRVTDEICSNLENAGYEIVHDGVIGWPEGILSVANGEYLATIFHTTQIRDILLGAVLAAGGGMALDWQGKELIWPEGGRVKRAIFASSKIPKEILECLIERG